MSLGGGEIFWDFLLVRERRPAGSPNGRLDGRGRKTVAQAAARCAKKSWSIIR